MIASSSIDRPNRLPRITTGVEVSWVTSCCDCFSIGGTGNVISLVMNVGGFVQDGVTVEIVVVMMHWLGVMGVTVMDGVWTARGRALAQ